MEVLRDRALLRAGRGLELRAERVESLVDLLRGGRDGLDLARGELAVVPRRRLADELADLLAVLGRQRLRELREDAACERPHLFERRQHLVLGPVVEPAGPELVVLVEALVRSVEVVATPREALIECSQLLVAVDVDLLGLRAHLVLEVRQGPLLRALRGVDPRDDRGAKYNISSSRGAMSSR